MLGKSCPTSFLEMEHIHCWNRRVGFPARFRFPVRTRKTASFHLKSLAAVWNCPLKVCSPIFEEVLCPPLNVTGIYCISSFLLPHSLRFSFFYLSFPSPHSFSFVSLQFCSVLSALQHHFLVKKKYMSTFNMCYL